MAQDTETIEFRMRPRTMPRITIKRQLRMDVNMADNVAQFAALTGRTEAMAWDVLAERGLLAMGAKRIRSYNKKSE